MADERDGDNAVKWAVRAGGAGIVLVGWLFIFWQNRFHVTAPVVIVCLCYFAIVATVFNLWRTGASTVAVEEAGEADSTWSKSLGARGELEREKKTLLKAIKEAEFDREMGKLSSQDAAEMIAIYRARAIEVIKELDLLAGGKAGTVREQIQREVKARIEILDKTAAATAAEKRASAKGKAGKGKAASKAAEPADKVAAAAPSDDSEDTESTAEVAKAATEAKAKADAAIEAATAAVSASKDPAISREQAAAAKAAAEAAVAEAEAALARAKEAARAAGADSDTQSRSSST